MSVATLEVNNLAAVEQALKQYPDQAQAALTDALERSLLVMDADLADYPSQASSSYVRTGNEGRGWTSAEPEVIGGDLEFTAVIGNNVPYGIYVQGENQAGIHVGIWKTTRQVEDAREDDTERKLQAALNQVASLVNRTTA